MNDDPDLILSRNMDIQEVEAVCLILGPYRNLTTMTASALFLHPRCQVLNHAGIRIFGNSEIDFLRDYSREKLDRFIQYAITISGKGQRGYRGGSITYSHAFESRHEMKEIFDKSGLDLIKKQIKCLLWKEPLRTANVIREEHVDLGNIFETEDRLRFLLPIRNPLDCAVSNMNTGHVKLFQGLDKNSSVFEVVQAILDEIFWFAELKKRFPDRFFIFTEHEISHEMLVDLAEFMQLDPDKTWITNALSAMKIKSGYKHDSKLILFYQEYIRHKGAKFPDLSKRLAAFY